MKNKLLLSFIMAAAITGCSSNKMALTEEGRAVQEFSGKPMAGCDVVGKVVGENESNSIDGAKNQTRNRAAELGANYILIQDELQNGNHWAVHAMAYKCP